MCRCLRWRKRERVALGAPGTLEMAGALGQTRRKCWRGMNRLMRGFSGEYLQAARDYAFWGLRRGRGAAGCAEDKPMLFYYRAYFAGLAGLGDEAVLGS